MGPEPAYDPVSASEELDSPPSYSNFSTANSHSNNYDPTPLLKSLRTLRILHILTVPLAFLVPIAVTGLAIYFILNYGNTDANMTTIVVWFFAMCPSVALACIACICARKTLFSIAKLKRSIGRKMNRARDPEEAEMTTWKSLEDRVDELVWKGAP